jgi:sodium/proline symporter
MSSSIFIGSAIVVAYTMLGGFWAVSLTDTLQGLLMALSAVLLPLSALHAVGGIDGLHAGVAAVADPGYADPLQGLPAAAAIGMVLGLLGIGLGYPGQPHVVNRFMAMRDDAGVRRGRTIAMTWAVVMYAGMIVLGLCARVLVPALPDGEVAFVVASQRLFGPVAAGVLLAAVLSAIMSTADSQLLVAASSVAHDVRPAHASTQTTVRTSRLTVLALSVGAVVAALVGDPSIFARVLFAWTAMGAAFGPLLLVELWIGPVTWKGRLAAMTLGFAAAVAGYVLAPGTAWERVAPFALALAVAVAGVRRINPRVGS